MEQSLVKSNVQLPGIIANAYESINSMNEFANILLSSKLVPDHFFEKGTDKKPDYTKGKIAAVSVVLLQAQQLNLPPMTALQHIIPVNGLLSIKGELAKTMIFSSGKLKTGSWKEEESGSEQEGNYTVSITATRSDNGATLTRSFGIIDAKRAGLWVSEKDVNGSDGWKYKNSAWWKYPKRMCMWRALGFLAKDLFSDVLMNTITYEEAIDIPQETVENIKTPAGETIVIPDKNFAQERSQSLTSKASEKIEKSMSNKITDVAVQEEPEEKKEEDKGNIESDVPFIPNERMNEQYLSAVKASVLIKIVLADENMKDALERIPGPNTNKKLRGIMLANHVGKLEEHVLYMTAEKEPSQESVEDITGNETKQMEADFENENKVAQNAPNDVKKGDNKFGIEVKDIPEGLKERPFDDAKVIYYAMTDHGIDNRRFDEAKNDKMSVFLSKYADKDVFCTTASKEEINDFLNLI